MFEQQLRDYVEFSKRDKKWRTAAANAITILIRAGVEFSFANLQGIRIPGADLSNGVFESADLQGADLRKTNLRNVWLHRADLRKAQMTGVQFGELPFLKHDISVETCTYSSDGDSFAAGLGTGAINVYATSNWEKKWTMRGHRAQVTSIAYSPNGDRIASGGTDSTVRLWDLTTGLCSHIFIGHPYNLIHGVSLVYSPHGDSVASVGSMDCVVRLWDSETGDCRHVFSPRIEDVKAMNRAFRAKVAYSPKGDTVASCCRGFTVRIWNVADGVNHYTLSGHTENVNTIAYSPQGELLASAGQDQTVRIWEVATGECRRILIGRMPVECVQRESTCRGWLWYGAALGCGIWNTHSHIISIR
jgi:WD40 repeat protein